MMARPGRLAAACAAAAWAVRASAAAPVAAPLLAAASMWAATSAHAGAPAPAAAGTPAITPLPAAMALIVHYNERPPHHYTERGLATGDAITKVTNALNAAHIPYRVRSTPAKEQLVLLQKNESPACMLAWVDLPGRDRSGKFSEVIYADAPRGSERRLWCTKATPDETMQRIDAALRNAALPK